jgi:membrane protein YdbS with pleckstrin-like domain
MAAAPEWLSLDPGEEVVWTGAPRLRRILSTLVTSALLSLAALAGAFLLTSYLAVELPVRDRVVWGGAVLWTLLQAVGPVGAYLRTSNTDYVLTDENVYERRGVLSERVTRLDVDRIQNVRSRKDFLGNLFDYGTIHLSTAGGGGVELSVEDLNDPDEFRGELRTRMRRGGDPASGDSGGGGGAGADPETVAALVDEARTLRETAERIERHLQ